MLSKSYNLLCLKEQILPLVSVLLVQNLQGLSNKSLPLMAPVCKSDPHDN